MVVSDLIPAIYLRSNGKTAGFVTGSTKWIKLLGLANFYQRRWGREKGIDWNSLYNPALTVTTVTATDTFTLPATIRKLSDQDGDFVRIYWLSDATKFSDFELVEAARLKDYTNRVGFCAQIGSTLKFSKAFVSTDTTFGGTIKVPAYLFPATLALDTDVVQVNDPDWLVTICAAEQVRNDITRQNQYPNLIAEANEIMQRMRDDDGAQNTDVYKPWRPFSGWIR